MRKRRIQGAATVSLGAPGGPKQSLFEEFVDFVKHNKKWWMLPIIIVLISAGTLLMLSANSATTPFTHL